MISETIADDARGSLVRCALALLEESGHQNLSVRRVAERAGVSSGAPYYHFADRRALLLALSIEGFRQLDVAAAVALERTDATPVEVLLELASSFLDFSAARPQLIDLMYESELTRPIDDGLEPSYRRAFEMMVSAITLALPKGSSPKAMVRAVAFWTSLFGLSRVLRQQLLDPFEPVPRGGWREAILDEIIAAAVAP